MLKKYLFPVLYGVILTIFTIYVVLDTFVITRIYSEVPSSASSAIVSESETEANDNSTTETKDNESAVVENSSSEKGTIDDDIDAPIVTDMSYQDDNISITITEYQEYDTSIYVADVQLSSAEYLQTALAHNSYGKNVTQKTSEIAEENEAILAINGDYYGSQEKGYVLRNGVIYRSTSSRNQEDLVIYADGSFSIITEGDISADELLAGGAQQVLSFGPALVMDGLISVTTDEEVRKAKTSNPRTAIGIVDDLHYVFVVSDGRTDESEGLSLYELAEFMQALGITTAYNLDGGGSSTMCFNGKVINNPTSSGKSIKERSVSDIVYIGY